MKRALAAVVLGAVCTGCAGGPGYVVRLGWNEARILWRREPIATVLARPDVAPGLRERLELVLAVREFARAPLGLDVGDSFTTFAEVGEEATVWVLSAAHRDRLEAMTWWYPVAGRVPYRGFFERGDADAAAAGLQRDGMDTEVRTAVAFSTLGWFADPLLSSTAQAPPVPLAETVLHESFHATRYVAGQSAFNESAATFVGHRGGIAFFCRPGGDPARCVEARGRWERMQARGRILGRLVARLRALYATAPPPGRRERVRGILHAQAGRALARARAGPPAELLPPNNARLLGEVVYVTGLDALEALAPSDADLPAAIRVLATVPLDATDPFRTVRERGAAGAPRAAGLPDRARKS